MSRPLRYIPEGGALVEVTLRTLQGRYLLRPDKRGRVNELVLGVVGRAQRLYEMSLSGISVMSTHMHLLCVPEDAAQLAAFMGHVGGNLSKEIGRLHDWPGKHARDWPGVHSAWALTREHPLRGWWFDRTREYAARRRGEHYGRYQYATEETVVLEPLPCWQHLPIQVVRRHVKDLVRDLERHAAATRRTTGKEVLGASAIMEADPHYRPPKLDRSPAPDFHARRKKVRQAMRDAYAWVVAAYREAAEGLRGGDRLASFPEGTFPPGLPFIPFPRGQPP